MQTVVQEAPPRAPHRSGEARPVLRWPGLGAGLSVLALLWFVPIAEAPAAGHAVAIAAAVITLFATEGLPPAVAGVLGLVLFWGSGAATFRDVTIGLRSESVWFIAGALVLGVVATRTQLAQRLAYTVIARAGGSYRRLLLAFIVTDFGLTFVVPSGNARVTILAAVVAGLVHALGLGPRSPVARGLLLIVTYTAGIFDKMILAGAASILGRGILEQVGGVQISYAQWFLAYLPCDLFTILVAWRAVLWLFPADDRLAGSEAFIAGARTSLGPMTPDQKRAALLLGSALALWLTDALHGQPPAYVAVGIALLALVPGIGVLRLRDLHLVPVRILVFSASVLGMSAALARSGGLAVLTDLLVSWLAPLTQGPVTNALALYWTAFVYHFFLGSESSMLSATLPAVLRFAQEQGHPVLQVGMIWIFGSGGKIFAYQSSVLMVGYAYGFFDRRDLMKLGFILTVAESVILTLLVPFYWPLVGIH